MDGHRSATNKTPFEKRLAKGGFETSIIYRALYFNSLDVHRDETSFISKIELEVLNVTQVDKPKELARKRQRLITVDEYALVDTRLGTISMPEPGRYTFKFPQAKRIKVRATESEVAAKFESAATGYGNTLDMYVGGVQSYANAQLGGLK